MNESSVVPAVTENSEISFVEFPYHHSVIKEQECKGNIPIESPVAVYGVWLYCEVQSTIGERRVCPSHFPEK